MNKKFIFILAVMSLILLCISCVSAKDLNNTAESDFDDLSNQINITGENQILNLDKDYKLTNASQKHILIDKSITIDGQNHVIEAPEVSRVFWVKADNVTIKNINFINSNTTDLAGGVISWWGNNGTLTNCNFTDNAAVSGGGAVLWKGNNGTITGCNFINNTVMTGVAISLTDGEGYDPSQLHILIVEGEGGALYLNGNNISVDYCNFIGNYADIYGGAIAINWGNNITVSNSKFKNNKARYHAGAIEWDGDNGLLDSSKFSNNYLNDLFLNTRNMTVSNSRFEKESCIETFYDDICYINVTFGPADTFDDLSLLINNTPEGGVLILDDDYKFINGSDKGIVISKSITIDGRGHTIDGSKLSRIFNITADDVVLKNINFINGNAIGSYTHVNYGGGAIYWSGDNGYALNCNFTHNSQYSVEPFPEEEIIIDGNRTIHVYHAIPAGAKTSEGGAIVWRGENGTVSNCIFESNSIGYANTAGAIMWRGNNGKIIDSEFYDNTAWFAGAIYWAGNNGSMISSKVSYPKDNFEIFYDQTVYWRGANGTVKDSIILGSDLYFSDSTKIDYNFWGTTIDSPSVQISGNLTNWIILNFTANKNIVMKGEEVTVSWDLNTLIDKNGQISNYYGINRSGEITFIANDTGIVEVTFENDQIKFNIIPIEYWDFNILSQKINETPEGGLLVLDRDYAYINGTVKGILISKAITIDGNGHTLNGMELSRIFNITADNVTLKNINFINGNAIGSYTRRDAGAGAIYWSGANGYIENCNFSDNSCHGIEDDFEEEETWVDENGSIWYRYKMRPMGAKLVEGGAIIWNGTNGTVFRCIFTNNRVGYANSGGAICWLGDNGKVLESEFFNNEAWSGASIWWEGNNGTVMYSKFYNTGEVFGRDIMWFGRNGTIRYTFLICSDSRGSALYPFYEIDADYNFWGDTIANPNQFVKIPGLNNWVVLNYTLNKNFVNKGDKIIVHCNLLLYENGKFSNFTEMSVPGYVTAKADKTGFVQVSYKDGKICINVVPKTKIVSSDLTKYYKQSKYFKVRVYGADGKIVKSKNVKFTIGKKTYNVKTDKNGYATLKTSLKPGKYTVTTVYSTVKVKNKLTVKTTLITKNIYKKVKKVGKFTVKVLKLNGKLYAKKMVKIKFKGKIYKIKTNKNGIATFNVPKNLKVGKYTIKTTCNGLTNTNKIIVKK